jgi:plastocyanin
MGQSYSYTFNTLGEFNYGCAFHPSMRGKVTVTE